MTPVTVIDRFWSKVEKGDGCWEWTAATSRGYGELSSTKNGVPFKAHRLSWEIHNGPIPVGMLVCHHCDNRRCVRPDHLFLGTNADNQADASRKGRQAAAARRRAKLTPDAVAQIRVALAAGTPQRSIAAEFGVHRSTVYDIKRGRLWAQP